MNKRNNKEPLRIKRKIEEIVEFKDGNVKLENIDINGIKYELNIRNKNGRLTLDFNDCDYQIVIDEEGIRFERHLFRPNHDHDDHETLQLGVDDSKMGVKKGELVWRTRFPYGGEGYETFYVEFGKRTVDY